MKLQPATSISLLALVLLTGCTSAPEVVAPLAAFEISAGPTVTEGEPLPAIQPGRTAFHATDPATVVLAAGKVQFVEFFAYWCAVCKAMAPSVHGLEDLYSSDVNFIYLDRDDPATEALRNQLGYIYQPHFFLLDPDGAVLGQWRGYVEVEVLQQAIVAAIE